MTEESPFRVEVAVGASREAVWRALSDRAELGRWFGWDYEGLSEEIDLIFFEHATPHAPDRIEFEDDAGGRRIELEADGPGRTLVRATKPAGAEAVAGADEAYDAEREGWRAFFGQLDHYLVHHDGEERRTISLTGEAAPGAVLALLGRGIRVSRFVALADKAAEGFAAMEAQADVDSLEPVQIRVTISAYGLDEEAFEALRARWEGRWRSVTTDGDVTG